MAFKRQAADEFLFQARNYLTGFLGTSWSEAWVPLGFATPGLSLPARDADRKTLLGRFEEHFVAHPERENAASNLTAANAGALHTVFGRCQRQRGCCCLPCVVRGRGLCGVPAFLALLCGSAG